MKSILTIISIILLFAGFAYGEEREVDFEINKGLEIIGGKESPRVLFFLAPLKFNWEKKNIDSSFFINKEFLTKDLKGLFNEEVKDVPDVR